MMDFLNDSGDDDPKRAKRRPLLAFLLVTLGVGAATSVFTRPNIAGWYAGLVRPAFAPPDWIFAPVWTLLYVLMAVAAWRIWKAQAGLPHDAKHPVELPRTPVARERRKGFTKEMTAYGVQLALNFAWSLLFFALHRMDLALYEIVLLLAAILACLFLFWRTDRLAGFLLLPYLAWTGFALALNQGFLALNPH